MKHHDMELGKALFNLKQHIKTLEETNQVLQRENEQLKKELIKVKMRGM